MKMFQAKKWLSTGYGLGVIAVCALLMAAGVNGVFNNVTASGTINSVGGYKFNGAAGSSGQALCSNGTVFNTPCNVAGSGITALTGPVTASGSGSVASTITATGVTAGSYTNGNFTVNAAGQLTAASNGAAPAAFNIIQSTTFTSCTLGDDGTGGSGCTGVQSWPSSISGSYTWWCAVARGGWSCTNPGNCEAMEYVTVSQTGSNFTYALNSRENNGRGSAIAMSCWASQ